KSSAKRPAEHAQAAQCRRTRRTLVNQSTSFFLGFRRICFRGNERRSKPHLLSLARHDPKGLLVGIRLNPRLADRSPPLGEIWSEINRTDARQVQIQSAPVRVTTRHTCNRKAAEQWKSRGEFDGGKMHNEQ